MNYELADIDVNLGSADHIHLSSIPIVFHTGEVSPYSGVGGTGGITQRAGRLGLKTEPFTGWHSAHTISLTGNRGTDMVLIVKINPSRPVQDGEWLWFYAMPEGVETYRN
jgi:hypothetical protein